MIVKNQKRNSSVEKQFNSFKLETKLRLKERLYIILQQDFTAHKYGVWNCYSFLTDS